MCFIIFFDTRTLRLFPHQHVDLHLIFFNVMVNVVELHLNVEQFLLRLLSDLISLAHQPSNHFPTSNVGSSATISITESTIWGDSAGNNCERCWLRVG